MNIRKYRIDLENYPYYNSNNNGIALFDLITAFLGAFILDKYFNLSSYMPSYKNKVFVYYLLVIPFGILIHHIIAHIKEKVLFPSEITFLNKKIFSLNFNVYHVLLGIILLLLFLM